MDLPSSSSTETSKGPSSSEMVQIEGMGTILFQCKNGEHHAFADVYFISNLTTNIVSVGQLDEGGFKIIIDRGVMVVRDSEGYLLAKV
jgi:hypothetical protein